MSDEAIGPVTVAMVLLGALFFLWPNLRPWVQEFRARAQTGSAQRAVLKNLQALEKVGQQEDEVDGAKVAATLLQAASHPKSEEQKNKNVKRAKESNKRGSPSKPSFATRFDLAAKAAIANTAQERSMAVFPKLDSSGLFRSDIINDSEASRSVLSASSPDHNATPTKKAAITESDDTGPGVDNCKDGDGGNDTYVFLSDVQPALEKVLVNIRNLDPLTKVISNVVSHPSDPKYRSLKLGHPTTKKVWYGSQRRLLEALGYTEEEVSTMASSADANSSLETVAVVELSYLSPSRLALHVHVARRLRDASERRRDEMSKHLKGHLDNSRNATLSGERSATNRATQAVTPAATQTTLVARDVLAKRLKAAAATGVLSLRNEPFFSPQAAPADPLNPNSSSRSSSSSSSSDLRSSAGNEDSSESLAPLEALLMVANALMSPECSFRLRVLRLAGTGLGSNSILVTGSRGAQLEEEQQQLHQERQHLKRIPFAKLSLGLDQPWASLQSLRNLDLDNNQLTALPPALSLLKNLERLSVSHNRLGDSDYGGTSDVASGGGSKEMHATREFSGATCVPALPPGLQRLALAGNGLRIVPLAVAALANLREVSMDLNRLKSFPEELFWCPRLERVSLAGNLISALPSKPTARPTNSDGLGSDLSDTPPNSTPGAGGALEAASTRDTSATTINSSTSRDTVNPLAALKHLDLSFNCFAVEGLRQAWMFTDTLLEGLALDGNVPGLSSDAFLALSGVASFMERRIKTKNKGQGGCWFAPGGVSSFGFCGLDHGNMATPMQLRGLADRKTSLEFCPDSPASSSP